MSAKQIYAYEEKAVQRLLNAGFSDHQVSALIFVCRYLDHPIPIPSDRFAQDMLKLFYNVPHANRRDPYVVRDLLTLAKMVVSLIGRYELEDLIKDDPHLSRDVLAAIHGNPRASHLEGLRGITGQLTEIARQAGGGLKK